MSSDDLTFSEYQNRTGKTAVYPQETPLQYLALGITGEAGEVAEKIKKKERDGKMDEDDLAREIGDVMWYLAQLAEELDRDLEEIARQNVEKLEDRKERDKISGSGDNR
jgi:NTP pyrophosphatase (non-canonical NTP hydrolase)